jgi:RNA polymerase sigma-70 factor (ECF subfamily)
VDATRFKRLIEPHLDGLFRAAFRLVRNRADAEDLVQDTCLRAYRAVAEIDESRPARAWLSAVMHNLYVDGARRAKRSPVARVTDDSELETSTCLDPTPEERVLMTEREEQLHRAWARLDRGHQSILALRAEGYSVPEIAAITEFPIDALQSRLYRARLNLARYLKEEQVPRLETQKEISQ